MNDATLFLRIIAGEFRGRQLEGPRHERDNTRPTLDRVKEALFDILARRVVGANTLDLFSGTGALGLEALSRGARFVTFVEIDRRNVKLIRENVAKLKAEERITVVMGDLPYAIGRLKGPYQLVFVDPPYDSDLVARVLPRMATKSLLAPNAIVVVERDRRALPLKFTHYAVDRRHRIGDTELWFLRFLSGVTHQKGDE